MNLMEAYLGITHESPEEKVLELLIAIGNQFVTADAGSILLVDEASNELVFAMTIGHGAPEDVLLGQRVPIGRGLVGLAAQTHQVQIGSPTFHLRQHRGKPKMEEPVAEIAAPMLINDNLIGVMAAVTYKADKRFSSAEGLFYARISTVAALIIEQRRRLATLKDLSRDNEVSGPLRKDEHLDLEIVAAISQLAQTRPNKKAVIARLLHDIQSFLES
jgi:GAF domain-containing protein